MERLEGRIVYWFHGASVGELDQAKALGRELKNREPNSFLILSWMSDSVTKKNLKDSPADFHYPLPLDGPFSYSQFLGIFQPAKLVLFAWDTWAWLIYSANARHTSIYLACATLGEKSARLGIFSKQLTELCFSWMKGILPAHSIHEPRFLSLLESVKPKPFLQTAGDSRFDSVIQKMESNSPQESFLHLLKTMGLEDSKKCHIPVIIFASTYPICETGILEFLEKSNDNSIVWIFPHKIEPARIEFLRERISNLKISNSTSSKYLEGSRVLIFDELGILAFAYRYAKFAYVGGGFHHRIHNVIEPAYWKLPILTGSRIENASEALVLESLGGLKRVSGISELSRACLDWDKPSELENLYRLGEKNKNFVMDNQGASKRIYETIWKN
jgi:3-deoxy-D-manno-octulosonic-acid transferase